MPKSTPKIATSVYETRFGIFSLTWSRSSLDRHSLHTSLSPPPLSTHLRLSPLRFWTNSGSKTLSPNTRVFWDPQSGFYVAAVVDGVTVFVARDFPEEAFCTTKGQVLVMRREHVFGNNVYATKAQIWSKTREFWIDCRGGDDPGLCLSVDRKRVLQVEHLKWKFRGNERIELDGVHIQVSWDVYNWLFEDGDQDGYALFIFRFEKHGFENTEHGLKNNLLFESQQSCGLEFKRKKMKKRKLRSTRSGSSSSLSSASSGCSSVMDWESVEENELKGPSNFSLLVYA